MVQEHAPKGLPVDNNPGVGDHKLCDERQEWKKEHSQFQDGKLWYMKVFSSKISLYNENRSLNVEEDLGILKQKLLIPLGSCISLKAERFMGRSLPGLPYKEDKWHRER